jgi:hypothetical protein
MERVERSGPDHLEGVGKYDDELKGQLTMVSQNVTVDGHTYGCGASSSTRSTLDLAMATCATLKK